MLETYFGMSPDVPTFHARGFTSDFIYWIELNGYN